MMLGRLHRIGICLPAHFWLTAVLVAIPSHVSCKDPEDPFVLIGVGLSSCGEFLRSADAEKKRRPANASPTALYSISFAAFASYADGFLSGTNYSDPIERRVSEHTDQPGRMAWLENYCRDHPLDIYITALMQLRTFLLK
jgi:hypothetical protein